MNADAINTITKAYHLLKGIRVNLPGDIYLNEGWVHEYHSALDLIQEIFDMEVFRVPDQHLTHIDPNPYGVDIIASYRGEDYSPNLSSERYIGTKTFCMKLDAALSYLDEARQSREGVS